MKRLLLILMLLPLISVCQLRDSIHIKTKTYEIVYSEVLQQPKLVNYTVQCTNGKLPRMADFYTNDSIKTSDDADYVHNVYDKGHMAPAAAFNCNKAMLKETFSYLNCTLQNQYLNRGVWKSLETQEREWAMNDKVQVSIKIHFDKTSKKLPTGATIPAGFYKTIHLVKANKTYKYYFPNVHPKTEIVSDYLIK